MENITAIILAAGSGSRMNSKINKQFMEINGKPIIWYSLFAFENNSIVDQIVLVTGKEDVEYCKREIVEKYNFKKVANVIAGGNERYESVYNGLKEIRDGIVLIHDGARPMITNEIIEKCVQAVKENGACIVGVPSKDTIKIVNDNQVIVGTPDRSTLWSAQTPQCFKADIVKDAYEKLMYDNNRNVTDDAMVVEKYTNHTVKFVEGDYSNIKVTTPVDIAYIEALLQKKTVLK